MKKDRSHLSLTMTNELHDKFRYVSKYDGRTMSAQVLWLVTKCVRDFEKEHGPIDPADLGK